MKTKYVAIIASTVLGLSAALFAADRSTDTSSTLVQIKSNGASVAELKIPKGIEITFTSSETTHDKTTRRVTSKGKVKVQIKHPTGPITINADEIEITPADR